MAKVKLQPLGRRVLVRPQEEDESKTEGGLIIPETADKEKTTRGIVVSLGKIRSDDDGFLMAEGDEVFFKKYSPNEVMVDGEKLFLIDEDDVLAVVK